MKAISANFIYNWNPHGRYAHQCYISNFHFLVWFILKINTWSRYFPFCFIIWKVYYLKISIPAKILDDQSFVGSHLSDLDLSVHWGKLVYNFSTYNLVTFYNHRWGGGLNILQSWWTSFKMSQFHQILQAGSYTIIPHI